MKRCAQSSWPFSEPPRAHTQGSTNRCLSFALPQEVSTLTEPGLPKKPGTQQNTEEDEHTITRTSWNTARALRGGKG